MIRSIERSIVGFVLLKGFEPVWLLICVGVLVPVLHGCWEVTAFLPSTQEKVIYKQVLLPAAAK